METAFRSFLRSDTHCFVFKSTNAAMLANCMQKEGRMHFIILSPRKHVAEVNVLFATSSLFSWLWHWYDTFCVWHQEKFCHTNNSYVKPVIMYILLIMYCYNRTLCSEFPWIDKRECAGCNSPSSCNCKMLLACPKACTATGYGWV